MPRNTIAMLTLLVNAASCSQPTVPPAYRQSEPDPTPIDIKEAY